jgi:hypothetical protein
MINKLDHRILFNMTAIVGVPNGHLISQDTSRRNVVPIIYTRGTHYEIGFDIVSIEI